MRKLLSNQNGYALYIVFALIIIVSILGISLQIITTSGYAKNHKREEIVLAQDLSTKGIDYIQTEIDTYFKQKIGSTGVTILEFEQILKDSLEDPSKSNYLCPKTVEIKGKLGITKICIQKSEKFSDKQEDRLKRIITVKSEGITTKTNQNNISYAKIVVGSSSVPEQLNYAISTNADDKGNGGNLFLFGGIDVLGDIKSDGDVYISKSGFSGYLNSPSWQDSTYAKLTAAEGNSFPKIIVNPKKNIIDMKKNITGNSLESFIKTPSLSYLSNNYRLFKVNEMDGNEQSQLQKLFKDYNLSEKNKPRVIVQNVLQDTINIKEEVNPNGKTILKSCDKNTDACNTITIKGEKNKNTIYGNKKDSYYIKGNLLVGPYAGTDNLENDQKNYYNITLQGKYYVEGYIDIKGAKLYGDATFYSLKDIDITSSVINGYDGGTNFFFANDFINISNISSGTAINNYSNIDGFFYTKGHFLMYGFGSNIKINGGISANRIVLTALRGKANSGDLISESRLRVNYDFEMIKKFIETRDQNTIKITTTTEPIILENF